MRLNQSGKFDYDYLHILGYLPARVNQRNRARKVMFCSPRVLRVAGAKIRAWVLGLAISQRMHRKKYISDILEIHRLDYVIMKVADDLAPNRHKVISSHYRLGYAYSDMNHTTHQKYRVQTINTLRPRQNGHHFADDIFKCISLNENVWIWITISLKFVPKGQINNFPTLVQTINGLVFSRRQAIIWTNDG